MRGQAPFSLGVAMVAVEVRDVRDFQYQPLFRRSRRSRRRPSFEQALGEYRAFHPDPVPDTLEPFSFASAVIGWAFGLLCDDVLQEDDE